MNYRSDIEGLRAVAVSAVILFHYGALSFAPGGFIGVDVFFVISGFLITSIILPDSVDGSFSFAAFYKRRALRILPPLIVVILSSLLTGYILLWPDTLMSLAKSAALAALGLSNIFFYLHSGYFDQDATLLPLLHTWSLAVEEQFYFLWPALLVLCLGWRRNDIRFLTCAVGILAVASFAACVWFTTSDLPATFYLLPFRTWELALGGLLAIHARKPRSPSRPLCEAAGLLGLAMIMASAYLYTESTAYPGAYALLPCLGCVLVIWSSTHGRLSAVSRLLSIRPLTHLGRISYALYLWHWPVLVFYSCSVKFAPIGNVEAILLLALCVLLAEMTRILVETPSRRYHARASARKVAGILSIPIAATVLISSGFVVAEGFPRDDGGKVASLVKYQNYDLPSMFRSGQCFIDVGGSPDEIAVPECLPEDGRPLAVLWGNSHIAQYYVGLVGPMAERGYALGQLTSSGCPPLIGFVAPTRPQCQPFNDASLELILQRKPELVVLGGTLGRPPETKPLLEQTVKALTSAGIRVVILGRVPLFNQSVLVTLLDRARGGDTRLYAGVDDLQSGRVQAEVNSEDAEWVAAHLNADFVSLYALLCPDDKCAIENGLGTPLFADLVHMTREGSIDFGPRLAAKILASR